MNLAKTLVLGIVLFGAASTVEAAQPQITRVDPIYQCFGQQYCFVWGTDLDLFIRPDAKIDGTKVPIVWRGPTLMVLWVQGYYFTPGTDTLEIGDTVFHQEPGTCIYNPGWGWLCSAGNWAFYYAKGAVRVITGADCV